MLAMLDEVYERFVALQGRYTTPSVVSADKVLAQKVPGVLLVSRLVD